MREVIDVPEADIRQLEQNEIVPVSRWRARRSSGSRAFSASPTRLPDTLHVFVIGTGSSAVGIAVDRIVGQREIVVRTIADPLVRVDGISGATDLGDGRVVLILDPAVLGRLAKQRTAARASATRRHGGDLRAFK